MIFKNIYIPNFLYKIMPTFHVVSGLILIFFPERFVTLIIGGLLVIHGTVIKLKRIK